MRGPKTLGKKKKLFRDLDDLTLKHKRISAQAERLQAQHAQLALKHQLLAAMCDTSDLLRSLHIRGSSGLLGQVTGSSAVPAAAAGSSALDSEAASWVSSSEQLLLQQLLDLPSVELPSREAHDAAAAATAAPAPAAATAVASDASGSTASMSAAAAAAGSTLAAAAAVDEEPVAPDCDCLRIANWIFQQPPFPGADCFTLPELLAYAAAAVRELSLQLHIHKSGRYQAFPGGLGPGRTTPLQRMQEVVLRFVQLQISLMLAGKEDLNMELAVTDHETGRRLQQPNTELYRHAIRAISLTAQQQQQRMVDGMAVFAELRQPIIQEMSHLQQQTGSSGSADVDMRCDIGSCSSSSSLSAVQERSQLQQQEGKCDRLTTLMRKEYLLRVMAASFLLGCMSYVQIAELVVYCSPFTVGTVTFAAIVAEEWHKQQQQ